MLACFLHSHLVNIANPGTYNDEVNIVFQLNNLPTITLPNDPPSLSIFTNVKLLAAPTAQIATKPQPAKTENT